MTGRNCFALACYCSCHRYRQRRRTFSLRELRPGIDGSNAPAAAYAPNRTNPAESKGGEAEEECARHRRHPWCRPSVHASPRKASENEAPEFHCHWLAAVALECGSRPHEHSPYARTGGPSLRSTTTPRMTSNEWQTPVLGSLSACTTLLKLTMPGAETMCTLFSLTQTASDSPPSNSAAYPTKTAASPISLLI